MRSAFKLVTAAIGAVALLALAAPAGAQQETTLQKIFKEKKVRITGELTSPPFGILDKDGKPTGSEVETARQLAKDLGVELELVQVTGPQRIPTLLSGRADVAISSLSITLARAQTVMFASPHGALSVVIAGKKGVDIKSAADLKGKRIGMTRATLEEQEVPKIAPQGTNIVFFDEHAATIQAMLSGQIDAAGMAAFAAQSVAERNPAAGIEVKFTVKTAYYAAAVRPGDHDLLRFINTWVFLRTQDGTLAGIYEKHTKVKLVPLPTF
jgi:polar amino acid transport system substrate-binding protein